MIFGMRHIKKQKKYAKERGLQAGEM